MFRVVSVMNGNSQQRDTCTCKHFVLYTVSILTIGSLMARVIQLDNELDIRRWVTNHKVHVLLSNAI